MAEALAKVKKDLGRGAVILHTRTIRRGGVMGVGARSVVEITASRDPTLLPKADRGGIIGPQRQAGGTSPRDALLGDIAARRDIGGHTSRSAQAEGSAVPRQTAGAFDESAASTGGLDAGRSDALDQISSSTSALRTEMEELRTMVRQLIDRPAVAPFTGSGDLGRAAPPIPDELQAYYTTLIQNAVADELARDVIARAKERLNEWRGRLQAVGADKAEPLDFQKLIPDALMEVIERMLPPADPVQMAAEKGPKFVALIGPTGVGKTTTIAKLAAQFKLREHKRVGLVTTDTYRIAAVAQLKAYADILSVPLEVVYTPAELAETMRKMKGFDVVLIDTSGRSQNDAEHLGDLQAFLDAARGAARAPASGGRRKSKKSTAKASEKTAEPPADKAEAAYRPLETHLVMSCTSHANQLDRVLERFGRLGIDRVVFTKLDEAVGVGVILNIAHRLDVQLSYLTTGQDVPDDIEISNRRRIAELILNAPKGAEAAESAAPGADRASSLNALA